MPLYNTQPVFQGLRKQKATKCNEELDMKIVKPDRQNRTIMLATNIFLFVALPLLCLSGCTLRTPGMNKLDSLTFAANLKADSNANYGKKAAYRDGRIYYLSSERGTQGIYSMNPQGEDVVLEIPVEDIRAISVQGDSIFFSGFAGIRQNINGPFRQFQLFKKERKSAQVVEYLENFTYRPDSIDNNVWDFYLGANDTVVVQYVDCTDYIADPWLSIITFQNKQAIPIEQYNIIESGTKSAQTQGNDALLNLSSLREFCFVSHQSLEPGISGSVRLYGRQSISVYDYANHRVAFPIDRLFSVTSTFRAHDFNRNFCQISDHGILFSYMKGLTSYHSETKQAADIVTFSAPEFVYQTMDLDDPILVFTEKLRGNSFLNQLATESFHQNRALQETLYRFDPETSDIVRLLSIGRNHAFLAADADTAVTGGGKSISIYDIGGDKAELLRTIQMEHNIVDRANKVDTAGGWLFLYRFNEQTQRDELIEKVYIGE